MSNYYRENKNYECHGKVIFRYLNKIMYFKFSFIKEKNDGN